MFGPEWCETTAYLPKSPIMVAKKGHGRRKVWKSGGLVVMGGDNVSPPGWDRVNWSAKPPQPPACDSPEGQCLILKLNFQKVDSIFF